MSRVGVPPWSSECGAPRLTRAVWQRSTPIAVQSGETHGEDVKVAVDGAGDAVAVWQGEDFTIEAAFRPAATGQWEAPVVISAPGEHSSEPQVAIREGGEVAAAWGVYEPETVPCPSRPSSAPCVLIVRNKDSVKAAFRPARATWRPGSPLQALKAQATLRFRLTAPGMPPPSGGRTATGTG